MMRRTLAFGALICAAALSFPAWAQQVPTNEELADFLAGPEAPWINKLGPIYVVILVNGQDVDPATRPGALFKERLRRDSERCGVAYELVSIHHAQASEVLEIGPRLVRFGEDLSGIPQFFERASARFNAEVGFAATDPKVLGVAAPAGSARTGPTGSILYLNLNMPDVSARPVLPQGASVRGYYVDSARFVGPSAGAFSSADEEFINSLVRLASCPTESFEFLLARRGIVIPPALLVRVMSDPRIVVGMPRAAAREAALNILNELRPAGR